MHKEVTWKFFLLLGCCIVVMIAIVPVYFLLRDIKLTRDPFNNLTLIWKEDFNNFDESKWNYDKETDRIALVENPLNTSDKCIHIGRDRNGLGRDINSAPPLRMEFDFMIETYQWGGDEICSFDVSISWINIFSLFERHIEIGRYWRYDKKYNSPEIIPCQFETMKWNHSTIFFKEENNNFIIDVMINGKKYGQIKYPIDEWEKMRAEAPKKYYDIFRIAFDTGLGIAFIDNVKVYGVPK